MAKKFYDTNFMLFYAMMLLRFLVAGGGYTPGRRSGGEEKGYREAMREKHVEENPPL